MATRQDLFTFLRMDQKVLDIVEVDQALRLATNKVNAVFPKDEEDERTQRLEPLRDDAILSYASYRIFSLMSPDLLLNLPDLNILSVIAGSGSIARGADTPSREQLSNVIAARAKTHFQEYLNTIAMIRSSSSSIVAG